MDRRNFLKLAGTVGASAALGGVGGSVITTMASARPLPSGTLRFYNWDAYIFESLFDRFKRETAITTIQMDLFYSEDEVWQTLAAGGSGYDLTILVDRNIPRAITSGLIEPLEKAKITNLDLLLPNFTSPSYDRNLAYTVPYVWGTTGIVYNSAKLASPYTQVTGWAQLFDVNFLAAYFKQVAMIKDMRETIGAALVHLGYSINETSRTALDQAKQALLDQKPYLASYTSSTEYLDRMKSGTWAATHAWNGDGVILQEADPNIHYVVPEEGGALWVDNFVIPKGAANRPAALAFINFMLDPAISTLNTLNIGYPNPNAMSFQWLPTSFKQDQAVYPPESILNKLEVIGELTPEAETRFEAAWAEVISGF